MHAAELGFVVQSHSVERQQNVARPVVLQLVRATQRKQDRELLLLQLWNAPMNAFPDEPRIDTKSRTFDDGGLKMDDCQSCKYIRVVMVLSVAILLLATLFSVLYPQYAKAIWLAVIASPIPPVP